MMKASEMDWTYLRRGMLLPCAALLVGLVCVAGSFIVLGNVGQVLLQEQDRLSGLQQSSNEQAGKAAAASEFETTYRRLVRSRVIGDERRLERVQALRDAIESLKLPYVRYNLSSRRGFAAPYLPAGLAGPVFASSLNLQLGLGHEVDLLRLFDRLDDDPGMFHVTSCNLTRITRPDELAISRPNVAGECTLDWLSIPAHVNVLQEGFDS